MSEKTIIPFCGAVPHSPAGPGTIPTLCTARNRQDKAAVFATQERRRLGFPGDSAVNNPPAKQENVGSIPGSGRSPGEGNSNPLQYSCLENPTDRGAGGLRSQKRQTGLSNSTATRRGGYHL